MLFLRSFVCFCVRLRLERPRLGTAEFLHVVLQGRPTHKHCTESTYNIPQDSPHADRLWMCHSLFRKHQHGCIVFVRDGNQQQQRPRPNRAAIKKHVRPTQHAKTTLDLNKKRIRTTRNTRSSPKMPKTQITIPPFEVFYHFSFSETIILSREGVVRCPEPPKKKNTLYLLCFIFFFFFFFFFIFCYLLSVLTSKAARRQT